jgi:hypothetical protein
MSSIGQNKRAQPTSFRKGQQHKPAQHQSPAFLAKQKQNNMCDKQ